MSNGKDDITKEVKELSRFDFRYKYPYIPNTKMKYNGIKKKFLVQLE